MDKDVHNENLTLQKEASNLLASEMSEIKGGTMSSICSGSLTKPDQALESDEFSSAMGCSSCNKNAELPNPYLKQENKTRKMRINAGWQICHPANKIFNYSHIFNT